MILTCPDCATSYFVDELRIPKRGRNVRCSTCGKRWLAFPEREDDDDDEPVRRPILAETRPEDDIEFIAAPILTERKPKPKSGRGLVVAVVILGVLAVAGAATVAFREQVARVIPQTAPLFAAIGLPVNTVGLALEAAAKPILMGGRPVLAVTGTVRNTTTATITAPPIRITLRGKDKAELLGYDVAVTNNRVPPGGVRYFAWNIPDPPAGALGVEVAFNLHAKPAAAPAPPAPVEAAPLPADAPDALPHHE